MINEIKITIQDFPRSVTTRIRLFIPILAKKIIAHIAFTSAIRNHSAFQSLIHAKINLAGCVKNINAFKAITTPSTQLRGLIHHQSSFKSNVTPSTLLQTSVSQKYAFQSNIKAKVLTFLKIREHNNNTIKDLNSKTQEDLCYKTIA